MICMFDSLSTYRITAFRYHLFPPPVFFFFSKLFSQSITRTIELNMGCVSSKVMSRSTSLKEDMNQSFQRVGKGFTVLEELCLPKNGGDHILALVCSANNVAAKLQLVRNLTLQSDTDMPPPLEAMSPEIINAWEMMAGLEEDEEEVNHSHSQSPPPPLPRVEASASLGKLSKSFHWLPEYASPTKADFEDELDRYDNNRRCRSFHIAQPEFDEMVERNFISESHADAKSQDLVADMAVQLQLDGSGSKFKACEDANENCIEVHGKEEISDRGIGQEENAIKELSVIEEILVNRPRHQQNEATDFSVNSTSSNAIDTIDDFVENLDTAVKGKAMGEWGLRRKAMANGLTTLRIPTAIDFPATTSLKEWLVVGGQLFSPGAYVTPRFGKFPLPIPVNENQCNDDSVFFDQEILMAFEEALQQLQAEEEFILRQISESSEEGSTKEKEMTTDHSQLTFET